jgi:STE24 endopeptidase
MHVRPVLLIVGLMLLLVARTAAQLWLNALNMREARRWTREPPPWLAGAIEEGRRRRSIDYTLAKARFAAFDIVWDAVLLALVAFSGVIPWSWASLSRATGQGVWASALFVLAVSVGLSVPHLPVDAWVQFRLEARFGFNRTTPRLWVIDRLKGLVLSLAIGCPLLAAVFALVRWAGALWWLPGFALVTSFQFVMLLLFPRVILPWFNKLEPLPDGALRERLLALAERSGFRISAISVMDGSKRSTHSNAFFTGMGRFRRIVLYDTLVEEMSEAQLEAVLAHEIGHSKKGHVARSLAVSVAMTFLGFGVLAFLLSCSWLYEAFGIPQGQMAPAFVLVGLVSGVVTFWLTPVFHAMSRKHEYEADQFARQAVGSPDPLVEALTKLSESNLSNLTPHPWYSRFYYSHPTWAERRAALLSPSEG